MINKYEAYWRWEKGGNDTYFFECCYPSNIQCSDCLFPNISLYCVDITYNVPTWNDVQKLMQEVYGNG